MSLVYYQYFFGTVYIARLLRNVVFLVVAKLFIEYLVNRKIIKINTEFTTLKRILQFIYLQLNTC